MYVLCMQKTYKMIIYPVSIPVSMADDSLFYLTKKELEELKSLACSEGLSFRRFISLALKDRLR